MHPKLTDLRTGMPFAVAVPNFTISEIDMMRFIKYNDSAMCIQYTYGWPKGTRNLLYHTLEC